MAPAGEAGLIVPPPDIRTIIDKTAEYVSRVGPQLEQKVLQTNANNPKFGFLHTDDHYHEYYLKRVKDFRQGTAQEEDAKKQEEAKAKEAEEEKRKESERKEQEEKRKSFIRNLLSKPTSDSAGREPDRPLWCIEMPADITPSEIDIIKLTAQFVARNGPQFLSGLINREMRNPSFEFLVRTHPWNAYFNALIQHYSQVILPPKDALAKINKKYNRREALDTILFRVEWERKQEQMRADQQQQDEIDRQQMRAIDWHDFVVVTTIDFDDDESKKVEDKIEQEDEMDIEMDADAMEVEGADGEEMIKKDYKPVYSRSKDEKASKVQVCPICSQEIEVDKMQEHMRVELLDRRFSEKKREFLEKQTGQTVLADNNDVTRFLNDFARRRTDIFGDDEYGIGRSETQDTETPPDAIWDGHRGTAQKASQAKAQLSIQQQIAAIHAKASGSSDSKPDIGPSIEQARPPATLNQPPTMTQHGQQGFQHNFPTHQQGFPNQQQPQGFPHQGFPRPGMPPQFGLGGPPGQNAPSAAAPGMPFMNPARMAAMQSGMNPGLNQGPPGMLGGQGMQGMQRMPMQPQGPHAPNQPPAPTLAPPPKRAKVDDWMSKLTPEDKFAAMFPDEITIKVDIPQKENKFGWKLEGQTISINVNVRSSVKDLCKQIQEQVGIPENKQKLTLDGVPPLKPTHSLATYNVRPNNTLQLAVKERGRGKK